MESSLLCLCLLLRTVAVQAQDIKNLTQPEFNALIKEAMQIRDGDVRDNDVKLYLFTKKNLVNPIPVDLNDVHLIDKNKPVKFVIHGYLENYKAAWYTDIKDELLKYDDVSVLLLDWDRVAKSDYISTAKNTRLVGNILGNFIIKTRIPLKKIHLIGHSLGAHVAGFASKCIKRRIGLKINRISGLDPAGPYFRPPLKSDNDRLSRDDAEIVDVIHTDGGAFGYELPLGTLDIYFNGGRRIQPGCRDGEISFSLQETVWAGFCSHRRSYEYFIQSINNENIVCHLCASYEKFRENDCSHMKVYKIIHQNVTPDMKGICFLYTEAKRPYRGLDELF